MKILITIIFIDAIVVFLKNIKKIELILMEKKVLIDSKKIKYESIISTTVFILLFVIGFRFLRIILIERKQIYFDFKFTVKIVVDYNLDYEYKIFIFVIFVVIFFKIKNIITLYVKINFLRVHYYYLLGIPGYKNFLFSFNFFENKIFRKSKKLFMLLYVVFVYLFKWLVGLVFLKNLLFDNGMIYLGLLPWYGLYYYLLSVKTFLHSMQADFERGSLHCYYPEYFGTTELGYRKLYHYHKKLISKRSKYQFVDSILCDLRSRNITPKNWVFFFYSTNKMIDVYEIAVKVKPKMIKNKM